MSETEVKLPEDVEQIMNEAASLSYYYSNCSDAQYKKKSKDVAAFDKKYGKGAYQLYNELYWDTENYESKYKAKIEALKKSKSKSSR